MKPRISILTEAGDGIGYGHLTRMTALAEQLTSHDANVSLIVDKKGTGKPPQHYPFQVMDWRQTMNLIPKSDTIVVDSYLAEYSDYTLLQNFCQNLVAIDDYDRIEYPASPVINPNPSFENSEATAKTAYLGGREWVLLRTDVRVASQKEQHRHTIERVAVTLGGSDVNGALPCLLESIQDKWAIIDVVAGNNEYAISLRKTFSSGNIHIHGLLNASELVDVFTKSDVVIAACGQTLHELAFLGVPAIGICVGDDQIPNQNFYITAGLLASKIDCRKSCWINEVDEAIAVVSSHATRQESSAKGRALIDGGGTERLSHLLINLMKNSVH